MRKSFLFLLLVLALTACSTTHGSNNKSSYPSSVAWNDSLYGVSFGEVPSTKIGKEIGEIKHLVVPMPKKNSDSNEKLGKLYEIKGKESQDELALEVNGTYLEIHKVGSLN
ncbi:lipoprotein [Paenibacillus sp. Soil522]|uniref:lipoprotein n=1 Tax=Paenibacillus sp. Soil522 TaxID=1736388 RepID=UPI0006FFCFE5|nr:lipoprotein [Paenibacillus sp. Soil522]KRE34897.1 hypothetical protein ASG81_22665 [Paenibacillus sp. Soil522]